MATKKVEKQQKIWYAVSDNNAGNTELYGYKDIEEAINDGGWDFSGKRYAYEIKLLGEIKQTVKIV